MALFQRFQRNDNLIKVAMQEPTTSEADDSFIQLIVGLGNIGKEFTGTRHNSGFMAIDAYAEQYNFPKWQEKTKFKALLTEQFIKSQKIVLLKPTTFYNLSGESVKAMKDFYKLKNTAITVIHDELDLPFGTVKEKNGGGSAGSNGLKSIISLIGADFKRIRIGISNELKDKIDSADFVLKKFSTTEKKSLKDIFDTAINLTR